MRKRTKESGAAEPLLLASKSAKAPGPSSSLGGEAAASTKGSIKALLSPLSAALSCQAPSPPAESPVTASGGSTGTVPTPESTPSPSPRGKRRDVSMEEHPLHGAVVKRMVPPGSPSGSKKAKSKGKKDPAYRHPPSPTPIALSKRSATTPTSLPTSFSSPSLSGIFKQRHQPEASASKKDGGEPLLQKPQSEEMERSRSYDCNYRHELEKVYEEFGFEVLRRPKEESLKQPILKLPGRQKFRGSAGSAPDRFMIKEIESGERKKDHKLTLEKRSRCHGPVSVDDARSAPIGTELCELSRQRMDTERLLSQMGMDVTEEDYCIEGEFTSRHSGHGNAQRRHSSSQSQSQHGVENAQDRSRGRCHSYDCNYNEPLEKAYEDFGVERKLVVLNSPERQTSKKNRSKGNDAGGRSVKSVKGGVQRLVRSLPGSPGNGIPAEEPRVSNVTHHKSHVHTKKTKVMSMFRGKKKDHVPTHIAAVVIPTNAEDSVEVAEGSISPEDMRMLHRWQTARIRKGGAGANDRIGSAPSHVPKMSVEDVLSIASSAGDKTVAVDNRGKRGSSRHRQGFSF